MQIIVSVFKSCDSVRYGKFTNYYQTRRWSRLVTISCTVMEEINLQGTVIRNNEGPIEVPKNKMCKSKFNPIIWKRNVSK